VFSTYMDRRVQWLQYHRGAFDIYTKIFIILLKFLIFLATTRVQAIVLDAHAD
jgi:hypothetical protein